MLRALLLFTNFFLILLAYYLVKAASRSLILEDGNVEDLPIVWIGSAVLLLVLMPLYQRLLTTFTRMKVVLGSCLVFAFLLVLFWILFNNPRNLAIAAAFYVTVDIFSVVLIEQFWSLTNGVFQTEQGKRWYGLVASGGLLGGLLGGGTAALLVTYTPLTTPDMLLASAALLGKIYWLTLVLARRGLYVEHGDGAKLNTGDKIGFGAWRVLKDSRYLQLIAAMLLLAQIAQPIVDYQFLRAVEIAYPVEDARTAFISTIYGLVSGVGLALNLLVAPFILHWLGTLGALLIQPFALGLASSAFGVYPSLYGGAGLKVVDRGLSYSINRAAKELLYVPIDPEIIYRAKAWIDMVGYRVFKIIGSILIVGLTGGIPMLTVATGEMSWVVLVVCIVWIGLIFAIRKDYNGLVTENISRRKKLAGRG